MMSDVAPQPTVYVAREYDTEEVAVRVCANRASALRWLADRIKPEDWADFYDAMSDEERAGLHREHADNEPEALLRGWHSEGESGDDWGSGYETGAAITVETVYDAETDGLA